MKCNWCGKGQGKNFTKTTNGDIYYYYCIKCIGFIDKEIKKDRDRTAERINKEEWEKNY